MRSPRETELHLPLPLISIPPSHPIPPHTISRTHACTHCVDSQRRGYSAQINSLQATGHAPAPATGRPTTDARPRRISCSRTLPHTRQQSRRADSALPSVRSNGREGDGGHHIRRGVFGTRHHRDEASAEGKGRKATHALRSRKAEGRSMREEGLEG